MKRRKPPDGAAQHARVRRPWLAPDWHRPEPAKKLPPGAVVHFGPDYHGDLPIWGIDWYNPPLSRDLLKLLAAWQDQFDDHFDAFGGWDSPEVEDAWLRDGRSLLRLVRRELGSSVTVEADWPVGTDG
jgi:hypothetical protein